MPPPFAARSPPQNIETEQLDAQAVLPCLPVRRLQALQLDNMTLSAAVVLALAPLTGLRNLVLFNIVPSLVSAGAVLVRVGVREGCGLLCGWGQVGTGAVGLWVGEGGKHRQPAQGGVSS
jgi:hypothetical protein